MFIDFDKVLGVHQQALNVLGKRSRILASNIVNADTPNYKARDIDFRSTLRKAAADLGRDNDSVRLEVSEPGHLSDLSTDLLADENLLYRVPLQPSLDGNTVDSQTEIAAYTENAIRYQASLRFLSGKFKSIVSALRGE